MLEDKLKELLNKGCSLSAVREAIAGYDAATGTARGKVITLITQLLKNEEILAALDERTRERVSEITGTRIRQHDDRYFIGRVAFPAVNANDRRIVVLEAKDELDTEIIRFKVDDPSKGNLLRVLMHLWQYLNRNITAEGSKASDVTVLNWGIQYSVHSNPFKEGIFAHEEIPEIQGTSLHFAAVVATISTITDRPVNPDLVFTGAFTTLVKSSPVGHLIEKAEFVKAERNPKVRIVIPPRRLFPVAEAQYINENPDLFIEVEGVGELISTAFGVEAFKVFSIPDKRRYTLGGCRIIAKNLGVKRITLFNQINMFNFGHDEVDFEVVHCTLTENKFRTKYDVFPLERINFIKPDGGQRDTMILLDFISTVVHTGNMISNNSQVPYVFANGIGATQEFAQIFAHPKGKNERYIGKYFKLAELGEKHQGANHPGA